MVRWDCESCVRTRARPARMTLCRWRIWRKSPIRGISSGQKDYLGGNGHTHGAVSQGQPCGSRTTRSQGRPPRSIAGVVASRARTAVATIARLPQLASGMSNVDGLSPPRDSSSTTSWDSPPRYSVVRHRSRGRPTKQDALSGTSTRYSGQLGVELGVRESSGQLHHSKEGSKPWVPRRFRGFVVSGGTSRPNARGAAASLRSLRATSHEDLIRHVSNREFADQIDHVAGRIARLRASFDQPPGGTRTCVARKRRPPGIMGEAIIARKEPPRRSPSC